MATKTINYNIKCGEVEQCDNRQCWQHQVYRQGRTQWANASMLVWVDRGLPMIENALTPDITAYPHGDFGFRLICNDFIPEK